MQINIDRTTNKAVFQPSPLSYPITIDDSFTLSKTIEVQEGEKQKENKQGQLLYKTNIKIDELGNETYEETTDSRTATKTEKQEQTITNTDENGVNHNNVVTVDVPVEWVENEPIMIPNMVQKTVNFSDNAEEFTVDEIVNAKYKNILEVSQCNYILADMFLNEDDIDLKDINHKANTGVAIMELLPIGQAKTKEITLSTSTKTFTLLEFNAGEGVDIYINDAKFVNNLATLSEAVSTCTIKFVNTTNSNKIVHSYAIGY